MGHVSAEHLGRAAQKVPAAAGSQRVPAGAGQLAAGPISASQISAQINGGQLPAGHIGAGQLRPGQKITVPARMPMGANLSVGDPAFDQVSRTVREITNMVPV